MNRKSVSASVIIAILVALCVFVDEMGATEGNNKANDPVLKEKFWLKGDKRTDTVWSIAFSPDGKYLAVATGSLSVATGLDAASIWDLASGTEKHRYLTGRVAGSLAWNSKGNYLLAASKIFRAKDEQKIMCWDIDTRKQVFFVKSDAGSLSVAFHPSIGEFAVACSDRTKSEIRSVVDGAFLRIIDEPGVESIAYSSDGGKLALATRNEIKITDARSGKVLLTLKGHKAPVRAISYSASGKSIASVAIDKSVKIWDTEKGSILRDISMPYQVQMVALSPNGKWVAIGGSVESKITLHDAESGRKICDLLDVPFGTTGLCFSRDGTMLAASGGYHVRVWEIKEGNLPAEKAK